MFLVRPLNQRDESLSSWRQRVAMANGLACFHRAPRESSAGDADLSPSKSTMRWLSATHGARMDVLAKLTLRALEPLLSFGPARACPRWVIPARYSRAGVPPAIGYCPCCLATDAQPYFRLTWRLAFVCACPKHHCLLATACPACGDPVWPSSMIQLRRSPEGPLRLTVCPVCRADLSSAKRSGVWKPEPEAAALLEGRETIEIAEGVNVRPSEYLAVLWVLCGQLLRARSRRMAAFMEREQALDLPLVYRGAARTVEGLPINARAAVLAAAHEILRDWPSRFLRFADLSGITAQHFCDDRSVLPCWFIGVLDNALRRQARGIRPKQIEAAATRLREVGRRVTKSSVAEMLGVSHSLALDAALTRRSRASLEEHRVLIDKLRSYINEYRTRRSSRETRSRNAAIIALAICTGNKLEDVVRWRRADIKSATDSMPRDRCNREFLRVYRFALNRYVRLRQRRDCRRPPFRPDQPFDSFRGGAVSCRSIQDALRICMEGHDPLLRRNVRSFFCRAPPFCSGIWGDESLLHQGRSAEGCIRWGT